ncbi:sugar ABC transporter substrate-binding protein [Kineothrix sp. MB12-C1]|uniref:sugar ABC transporter substrate-binding protein n=1 Tax=Kineothrix sp. MB12-C1 TaxID=3070215 RepID=UPI0027D25785|nr:substrate-binding domain-containing protein [Kineothrix sp. MB12-C1]WMC94170.1 substrate-binding domain-containing protein [Kineothrix sp. MB12-C1]
MKKRIISLALVGVMAFSGLVGCGAKAPAQEAAGAKTETAKEAEAVAEPAKEEVADTAAADNFKVGITLQSLENSYWAGVFGEVEKLLKEKGWEYTILACNDNSATQIQQIENFITNQVNLIMVHPSDPNAIEDYLKQARDAGIKVMCWDDAMTNTDLNWILDNTKLGYVIGQEAANFINENYPDGSVAEVAIMNYPQTPILLERETGILNALEEIAGGKYKVVAQQPALDAQAAITNMETILQANPDTKIVCSIGAGGDIGANQAFMTKMEGNIPDDMGIFSADATQQQLEAIVNGEATRASVGFEGSNKKTAEAVVDLYERLLNGETFAEQNLVRPLLVIDSSNAAEYLADYK